MIRFAEVFPEAEIVHSLSAQLGWTHFRDLLPLSDPIQREFYAEMCRIERWSTRTLRKKIDSMLFERTAISKKPEEVARAEYKGQMELYLRWLAKHEQQPDEESPLGIILCAGKKQEQIELLELGQCRHPREECAGSGGVRDPA